MEELQIDYNIFFRRLSDIDLNIDLDTTASTLLKDFGKLRKTPEASNDQDISKLVDWLGKYQTVVSSNGDDHDTQRRTLMRNVNPNVRVTLQID